MTTDSFSAPPIIGQRIAVIGVTGSGKTTLAARLARQFGACHIELDALHWGPHWTEAPLDVFRARVDDALSVNAWVIDGNYRKVRDIIWARADTVIWLDYALPVILARLFKRTLRRVLTREELWSGNRETVRGALFSRNSLFIWALKTYRRRKREYPVWLTKPEYQHLTLIRLTSPRAADDWLKQLEVSNQPPLR
ncbi:MAG: AAA family ATPase [Chloroflexi bacterium]|nr:AAA family ATPase [Chloroflexota bacterium]